MRIQKNLWDFRKVSFWHVLQKSIHCNFSWWKLIICQRHSRQSKKHVFGDQEWYWMVFHMNHFFYAVLPDPLFHVCIAILFLFFQSVVYGNWLGEFSKRWNRTNFSNQTTAKATIVSKKGRTFLAKLLSNATRTNLFESGDKWADLK